jgi:flagellar biosynthesis/type III secretory pathway M-ring protein FliF/YscJ
MTYVIVLVILFIVVFVITAPLRRPPAALDEAERERDPQASPEALELEAARDAKYREIRDAELDHQTGKLSDQDFQAIDSVLRAEAIEILRRLDSVRGRGG